MRIFKKLPYLIVAEETEYDISLKFLKRPRTMPISGLMISFTRELTTSDTAFPVMKPTAKPTTPLVRINSIKSRIYFIYIKGGKGGIRTLETLAGLLVFETSDFDHSPTFPYSFISLYQRGKIFAIFQKSDILFFVYGPIVYRLGQRVFNPLSRVRLSVGSPMKELIDFKFVSV
jgi:hypothetical protein